jgi:hypothetical protein
MRSYWFSPAMIQAEGENCFVKNVMLVWKASSSTGYYQSQMYFENYEQWLLGREAAQWSVNIFCLA